MYKFDKRHSWFDCILLDQKKRVKFYEYMDDAHAGKVMRVVQNFVRNNIDSDTNDGPKLLFRLIVGTAEESGAAGEAVRKWYEE